MSRLQRLRTIPVVRTTVATLFAGALALGVLAPAAHAGILVRSATDCPQQAPAQPFAQWGDPASYVLVPQGGLESTAGWSLQGAQLATGNESFFVGGAADAHSLSLPAGTSATTPVQCVGLGYPTLRFFVRRTGSPLSVLKVDVLLQDNLGLLKSVPMGVVAGDSAWMPTLPLPVIANLLPLLPGDLTPVRFRFTPVGLGGDWQVDDVYVDPYRTG
jgi:hypothetical protein